MSLPIREALRYFGAGADDPRAVALITAGFEALAEAPPRHRLATLPVEEINGAFRSRALAEHLRGCETAVLMAATLGARADCLIRRAEAADTLRALALHACAAAKIEAYCDAVQAAIPEARRPRFSPGYGDFALAAQQKLLALTDAGRRIGLYLTEGDMLAPAKSVTAVMGLGPAPEGCGMSKCARCSKADCQYRGENTI